MEPVPHLSCKKGLTGFKKEEFFYFYYKNVTKTVLLLHRIPNNGWPGALDRKKRSSILVVTVLLVSKSRFYLMQEVPKFSESLFLIGPEQYP
jgi:hypothetical protein